jgi:hypothetical protein
MILQLNVPNVFLVEPVKILPRSSNNESIIAWSVTPISFCESFCSKVCNFSSSMFSWKSVTFSFTHDFILVFEWLVFLTVLLLLSLLFKLTDKNNCSGAWTSENCLLLSRISKSNNNFKSSGLVYNSEQR